ncbi:MAG: beta-lactamase family protein [Vicinamibacteria bacterium]|nr:beta-lactamase family protein [Vicinamibacteria bacterium]
MSAGMKRIIVVIAVLVIGLVVAGVVVRWTTSRPAFESLHDELQYLVSECTDRDKSVKNCVLSVVKGDGSFSWSGAGGTAQVDGRIAMTTDTPIFIASVTKLYTAAATMRLYEARALSLDDPMAKHLPEELIKEISVFKGKDYTREITIRHLLSHASGIPDYYTDRPEGGKNLFEMLLDDPKRSWSVEDTIARARNDLTPHFAPGTDASYSDTNYQLLGKILEKITGKPLHVVFREFFFEPLGLRHTWLVGRSEPADKSAAPADVYHNDAVITKTRFNDAYWADGGIISTVRDGIVFLTALKEGRLVTPETLALMHQWRKIRFPLQYGYGTMYVKFPGFMRRVMNLPPLWGHSGSTGSFLYYSEDLDLYLAGTINQTNASSKPFRLMGKVIKAIQSRKVKPMQGKE